MSGYSGAFWLALCAGLTGLGLVLTVAIGRRRSVRAMLHGGAWSLIPIAAYMTGSTVMFWRIGEAIGKFASSFVFDQLRWAGLGVTAVIVVAFAAGGSRERRKAARQARAARRAGAVRRADAETGAVASAQAAGAVTSGAKDAVPVRRAAPAKDAAPAKQAVPAKGTTPAKGTSPLGNDLADIEDILRKRGILPEALE